MCVCMGPKQRAGPEVRRWRSEAIIQGWHSSHWPWEAKPGMKPNNNQDWGRPKLSEEQLDLVL